MDTVEQVLHILVDFDMRYASLDIPKPVIDAIANGTLAIFAGSGVPIDPPSNCPDFGGLADEAKAIFGFAVRGGGGSHSCL